MTDWKKISLDSRLSDRKYPLGSENSSVRRQNSTSVSLGARRSSAAPTRSLDDVAANPTKSISAAMRRRLYFVMVESVRITNMVSTGRDLVEIIPLGIGTVPIPFADVQGAAREWASSVLSASG